MTLPTDWARCKPWIAASVAKSALADDVATIETKLSTGVYYLESSANAAAIIEFCRFGERDVILIRFGGGSLDELLNIIEPRISAHARETGRLTMSEGRLGWVKAAKAHGYQVAWVTMVKE